MSKKKKKSCTVSRKVNGYFSLDRASACSVCRPPPALLSRYQNMCARLTSVSVFSPPLHRAQNHMLLRVTALLSMNSAQKWVKGWRRCIAGALSSPGADARRTFSRFYLHLVYMQWGTHTWFCPQILTKASTIIKKPQHNKGTICWCGHTHSMCESSPQDSIPVCHPAVETPPKRFVFISRARLKILGHLCHQAWHSTVVFMLLYFLWWEHGIQFL